MNRGPPSTTIVSPVLPCMALFRSASPAPPASGPARWRRLPAPPSSFLRSISWVRPMAIVVVFDKPCVGKSRQSGLHDGQFADARVIVGELRRSEEHTSGLQSLMHIMYSAFRLQHKNIYSLKN